MPPSISHEPCSSSAPTDSAPITTTRRCRGPTASCWIRRTGQRTQPRSKLFDTLRSTPCLAPESCGMKTLQLRRAELTGELDLAVQELLRNAFPDVVGD